MSTQDALAEMEAEQGWRLDEIRFFQNLMVSMALEEERDRYRRVLVLLVYAHFEGFCQFALLHYVRVVNLERIKCGQAHYAIAAASLADVFAALRDERKKCPQFRHAIPDDTKLHLFARDREFIERVDELDARVVSVDDRVVDTESNLSLPVLRKNLFRLGLPFTLFDHLGAQISLLLHYRNGIAHGRLKIGVTEDQYRQVSEAALAVIDTVKHEVGNALREQAFLRAA